MKKNITKSYLFGLIAITMILNISGQNILKNKDLTIKTDDKGIVESFTYESKRGKKEISFRKDEYFKGPALFFNEDRLAIEKIASKNADELSFSGKTNELDYKLSYHLEGNAFVVEAEVTNRLDTSIKNPILTLKPGVNTELEKYPEWNDIFFPTLLRSEKTHFWGYIMNGNGEVVSMGTKDPVASWQMEYHLPGHWRGKGGHLIFSYRLDLMHKLPLPDRHPKNLTVLKPKETKKWRFYLKPVDKLEDVKPELAKTIKAPMIDADHYTVMEDGAVNIKISSSNNVTARITNPKGKTKSVRLGKRVGDTYTFKQILNNGPGVYTLKVTDKTNGKISEAKLSAHKPYSWYMDRAREATVKYGQYANSHLEGFLGLHSGLLARKYSDNEALDTAIEKRLNTILSLQWDDKTHIPKNIYEMRKVANTAQMISILVDAYEATGNIHYLEKARGFATIIMTFQYENGDYADYTAIFYPAKSIMELMSAEKELYNDPTWAMYYDMHYASVKRAIDYLVDRKDNIMTEGQQTFEDGMLGSSATQISMFALLQKDPARRKHYAEVGAYMAKKRQPLDQLIIPDSRMNGGSIRFWEAQYDILEKKKWNLINSPHGWSAWRLYGIWYQYLLTGEETYLSQVLNGLGACIQLIDTESGTLRWAFVTDPYAEVEILKPNPSTPGVGQYYETTVGEQYLNMIGDFHYPKTPETIAYGNPRISGWACNNDVHEIFKLMEEVCLTAAYVLERKDGSFATWNCKVTSKNGTLEIHPAEGLVKGVHLNLQREHQTIVHLKDGVKKQKFEGMGWIGKSAFPTGFIIPKDEAPRMVRGRHNK